MPETIVDIKHPCYSALITGWEKFRLTFIGGKPFIDSFLQPFSKRESNNDFEKRKLISYSAAHSKASLMDMNNAIFTRMIDINREGGPASYKRAVAGEDGGVDLEGSGMNSFLGLKVMPWLLAMGKIGIFIDKPGLEANALLSETRGTRPYLYTYQTEDILNWSYDSNNRLEAVLLRDRDFTYDSEFALPTARTESFRYMRRTTEGVLVQFLDKDAKVTNQLFLNLQEIPFVILELNQSLLFDVADYQIALMNMGSSDINYALKSNYPFYTEQYDPRFELPYQRPAAQEPKNQYDLDEEGKTVNDSANPQSTEGSQSKAVTARKKNTDVGTMDGRRYPLGAERPDFIHPSPEPLRVSMEKQAELRNEIRILVSLAVQTVQPVRASAESKDKDDNSLEAGLARIAAVLQDGERRIATVWLDYEKSKDTITIKYPEDYSLQSKGDRLAEAERLEEMAQKIPSLDYQKAVHKRSAELTVAQSTSDEELDAIKKQIDSAIVQDTNPDHIAVDVELGLVTTELASEIRGYPEGQAEKAQKERAERLAMTSLAQSAGSNAGARGIDAGDPTDDTGKDEKTIVKEGE